MTSEPAIIIEPNRCNCTALRKASRRMSQFYDAALAPSGLRATQFAILVDLARRGDSPPTIRDMSETMALDQSTIGQNLRPLEREGLVALVQDEADRRSRRIQLTKAGWARFTEARPLWQEAQEQFESSFGKRAAAELRSVLATVVHDPSLAATSND